MKVSNFNPSRLYYLVPVFLITLLLLVGCLIRKNSDFCAKRPYCFDILDKPNFRTPDAEIATRMLKLYAEEDMEDMLTKQDEIRWTFLHYDVITKEFMIVRMK